MGAYEYRMIDTDGDSLDDNWEMRWFGDLNHGADEDFDGDWVSNRREYIRAIRPVVFRRIPFRPL